MKVESVVEAKLIIRFELPGAVPRSSSGMGGQKQLEHGGFEQWVLEVKQHNWQDTARVFRELAEQIEKVGATLPEGQR